MSGLACSVIQCPCQQFQLQTPGTNPDLCSCQHMRSNHGQRVPRPTKAEDPDAGKRSLNAPTTPKPIKTSADARGYKPTPPGLHSTRPMGSPVTLSAASAVDQAKTSDHIDWEAAARIVLGQIGKDPRLGALALRESDTIATNKYLMLKQQWNNACRRRSSDPTSPVNRGKSEATKRMSARHPEKIAIEVAEQVIREHLELLYAGKKPRYNRTFTLTNERDEAREACQSAWERTRELEAATDALETRVKELERDNETLRLRLASQDHIESDSDDLNAKISSLSLKPAEAGEETPGAEPTNDDEAEE